MTYSSSLALGRKTAFLGRRNQNNVVYRGARERALGPVSNTVILIVLALVLGMLYLTQVTKTNAYGYRIDSLQKEQASLAAQHSDLQVDSARLQAVARIKTSDQAKNLAAATPSETLSR